LGFLIGILPGQSNRLRLLVAYLHPQPTAGGCDRQVPVSQATDQVEGLARRLLQSQALRVHADALFDRLTHLRCRPEEAVGGHQAVDALVRPLEVVGVHEKAQTPLAVGKVRKHRPTQEFLPQRLPESLHLPERLRMLGPTLDVPYPLTPKLSLEVGLASPRRVLASLVGQDFLRSAVGANPSRQGLHHKPRPLMVRQRKGHNETRVVVHEGRQVQPLGPSQEKSEDVRLPHLVGRCPFEAPRRVFALRGGRARLDESRVMKNSSHMRLAHPQRLEACQDVADASRPVLGMLLAHLHHRIAFDLLR
jgi:hypothetical protein